MYKFKNKKERIAYEMQTRGFAVLGYTRDGYVRLKIAPSITRETKNV